MTEEIEKLDKHVIQIKFMDHNNLAFSVSRIELQEIRKEIDDSRKEGKPAWIKTSYMGLSLDPEEIDSIFYFLVRDEVVFLTFRLFDRFFGSEK